MSLTTAFAVFSILVLSACGGAGPGSEEPVAEETPDRLVVYTVNYPLAYFAERLGGDEVEVVFPAPADRDPAFWSPDAGAIAAYQGAGLILLNGAGYAKWVERATLPIAKMVNTTTGVGDRLLELNDTVTHSHGPGGEHEHRGWAFTTWLDPTLAIEQARTVAAALSSRLPSSKTDIAERMGMLEYELVILDTRLAAATEALGDEPLIFSHPVYQYLIARYGLKGYQIHWEPGVAPDGQMWSQLENIPDHDRAKWMLWEDEPLATTVAALDERGLASIVFSPCGNTPAEGDWLTVMAVNAEHLESIAAATGDAP